MAEDQDDTERTEDPTQKRLDEAIERGDVVKSQEVNTWFVIAASALVLLAFSGPMGMDITTTLRGIIANSHAFRVEGGDLIRLMQKICLEVMAAVAVPILLLAIAALFGNVIQHRLIWSVQAIAPKLSKISPIAGLQRLFSKQALASFVKGLLKLALVGAVLTALLWPERHRLEGLIGTDVSNVIPFTRVMTLKLLGAVVAILAIIAAADYFFQYRQWYDRHKMSVRELKEEFKQTEGDPKIKAKIKQIRHNRARRRMMSAVPKATVVVTNPTHFAVALHYERGMPAPICVAKGADLIARKMREIATEHNVPVVENPPLARTLYATVEIDQEIPPEHYKAVAEIIGYVMRLKRTAGGR
jgi:flagellar biosynthesis protein FlhB